MCGIFAFINSTYSREYNIRLGVEAQRRLQHRGPDWKGISEIKNGVLAHSRLSIMGVHSQSQPFRTDDGIHLTINGEIYNYKDLDPKLDVDDSSDCYSVVDLYQSVRDDLSYLDDSRTYTKGVENLNTMRFESTSGSYHFPLSNDERYLEEILNRLSGDFAFVLVDEHLNRVLVARDPIGVVPLYYGLLYSKDKLQIAFASEMKALTWCDEVNIFPPGAYFDGQITTEPKSRTKIQHLPNGIVPINSITQFPYFKRWYKPGWRMIPRLHADTPINVCIKLRELLISSVEKRMMSEVPFGCLLSGGLDSSIVSAIASQCVDAYGTEQLNTFSIGLKGSPDLEKARMMANFIGSKHHEFTFTIEEGLEVLRELIYHLETYDITTIRASTPMFLLAKHIKAMGFKMVLSGEGADEIFGGYLYFHNAPNDNEFKKETIRLVDNLHSFDCLRANKSTMASGLEVRVPFLDKDFLDYAMQLHPDLMMRSGIEKWILREAFRDFLPPEIYSRQKEQFSDGVGYGWISSLKRHAQSQNKTEGELYESIYKSLFPSQTRRYIENEKWKPQWSDNDDPSGLAQSVHTYSNVSI